MKLSRIALLSAFMVAVMLLMGVVPGAPRSASAQGPAAKFECNYTTAISHPLGGGADGTPAVTNNQAYLTTTNLKPGTTDTYVNSNVLFSLTGTSSFSGIGNRRQLRATVTTTVISSTPRTVSAVLAARGVTAQDFIRTTHVVEFQNYANNDGVCTTSEMCFVALGEGLVTDYAANTQEAYNQLTANNDNLDITLAVTRGEQQLKSLCGRLTVMRSVTSDVITNPNNNPVNSPNYDPAQNPAESQTEWSKLTANYLYFTLQGALCQCQGPKSGPTDYGQQNNQSGGGSRGPGQS